MPKTPVCCLAGQTPAPAPGSPDDKIVKLSCLLSGKILPGSGAGPGVNPALHFWAEHLQGDHFQVPQD